MRMKRLVCAARTVASVALGGAVTALATYFVERVIERRFRPEVAVRPF